MLNLRALFDSFTFLGTSVMILFSPKFMFFTFLNFNRLSIGENLLFISAFLIAFNNLRYAYMKEMPQTHVHKRSDPHEDTTYQHLMLFCI